MGLFDAISRLFGGGAAPDADEGLFDDPPVPFKDGVHGHAESAEEVFERFCRTVLCTYVESVDAHPHTGLGSQQESALAVVTTTLRQHPDDLNDWASARSRGDRDAPNPELWEFREQCAIALAWVLTLDPPLVMDLLVEPDAVMRADWDDTKGTVTRKSLIDALEAAVRDWSRERLRATEPKLRDATELQAGIDALDEALDALAVRVSPGRDAVERFARLAARRDTLLGVRDGRSDAPLTAWRDRQAQARRTTGEMTAEDWTHFLLVASRRPLPEGVTPRPAPRQALALERGDTALLDEDEAGVPALAWALWLTDAVDAPVSEWFPPDRVATERLIARATLRDVEVLRKRRDALRKKNPAATRMLRLVLKKEPRSKSRSNKRVFDEEHQTWHEIEVSSARYRPREASPEPPTAADPPPVDVLRDQGDTVFLETGEAVSLRGWLDDTRATGPLPWVRRLHPAGPDLFVQVDDSGAVRLWRVTGDAIVKEADSAEDLLRRRTEPRTVGAAHVRRGEHWVKVVFAGPGPIALDLTGPDADLETVLAHADTELDGTTLILPNPSGP